MLHLLRDIKGLKVAAADEQVGHVTDVLFDDLGLAVRYFVVKTGTWLSGRELLLSPLVVTGAHPEQGILTSTLTKEQIESSPPLETHPPVSRQYEEILANYYNWSPYWGMPLDPAFGDYDVLPAGPRGSWLGQEPPLRRPPADAADSHLQSAVDVDGYSLQARDGDLGHVRDFLVDDRWRITYLVVDCGHWFASRKVVVGSAAIRNIAWEARDITVALSRDEVRAAPAYNPKALGATFESDLTVYYKGLLSKLRARLHLAEPSASSVPPWMAAAKSAPLATKSQPFSDESHGGE